MKRYHVPAGCVLGLALGAIGGWLVSSYYSARWVDGLVAARWRSELGNTFHALESARAGDTNAAVEALEAQLDLAIVGVASTVQQDDAAKTGAVWRQYLARVREYRKAHPRKSESIEVDNAVREALSVADTPAAP